MGITESWITKDILDSLFHIKGNKVLRCNCCGRGRGCVLYIKNNLVVMELVKTFEQIDSIWCNIALLGKDNIIVGVCYRSANSKEEYN